MPERIQLKRTRGWRMPAGAVKVDRTTRWGNPFTVADAGSIAAAVDSHARWMRGELAAPDGASPPQAATLRAALADVISPAGARWTGRAMRRSCWPSPTPRHVLTHDAIDAQPVDQPVA